MVRVRRASKKEQLQRAVRDYMREQEISEVDPDALTTWAINNDRIGDDVLDFFRRAKRDLIQAMRDQHQIDQQGREIRKMIAIRYKENHVQKSLWMDLSEGAAREPTLPFLSSGELWSRTAENTDKQPRATTTIIRMAHSFRCSITISISTSQKHSSQRNIQTKSRMATTKNCHPTVFAPPSWRKPSFRQPSAWPLAPARPFFHPAVPELRRRGSSLAWVQHPAQRRRERAGPFRTGLSACLSV